MDLSFSRFDPVTEVTVLPGDLAALMLGIAARQAASPTAAAQARAQAPIPARAGATFRLAAFDVRLLAPLDGAFNGPMARAITCWKDE